MSFRDSWVEQDNSMGADAEVVNQIANAVIQNEKDIDSAKKNIPTKISQLENDTGYITESAIPEKLSEFENDKGFITDEALPKKVSQLENDAGYVTKTELVYDTIIHSQEEWDAMIASSNWNGAKNILLKCNIDIRMGTSDEQGSLKIPLTVSAIDGNHYNILIFYTDIQPFETYAPRLCLFNIRSLQLVKSKWTYIKTLHHCSLNIIQGSSVQNSTNIVNCSASFGNDGTLVGCDTILLDSASMERINNSEYEVLVDCTNVIYEKTKLSEFDDYDTIIGGINSVLDELHSYAQSKITGGEA